MNDIIRVLGITLGLILFIMFVLMLSAVFVVKIFIPFINWLN